MPLQYVSLLATSFSGSTLVSMLMGSQPRVVGFGDTYVPPNPDFYPKHPCTCGSWYEECPPRAAITNAIRSGGVPDYSWDRAAATPVPKSLPWALRQKWPLAKSSSLPFYRGMPGALRRILYRRFYLENAFMLKGLEDTGMYDVYFDGCKSVIRTELLRSTIPDIKVVHMVRHPGAYFYHFHRKGDTQYEKRLRHWFGYNNDARSLTRSMRPENYRMITYESIVKYPEQFVETMESFIGMKRTHSSDRSRIHKSQVHVIGNRMRETADRVLDYSNTWRGKMPADVEEMADEAIRKNSWLRELYSDS
jgi:hypothetical protein